MHAPCISHLDSTRPNGALSSWLVSSGRDRSLSSFFRESSRGRLSRALFRELLRPPFWSLKSSLNIALESSLRFFGGSFNIVLWNPYKILKASY